MQTQLRMTPEERILVGHIAVIDGCVSQLPDNVHVSLDLLRRRLGYPPTETLSMLRGMASIGFDVEVREDEEHGEDVAVVRWVDTHHYTDEVTEDWSMKRSTEVAVEMLQIGAPDDGCLQCAIDNFKDCNFSNLSSATLDSELQAH